MTTSYKILKESFVKSIIKNLKESDDNLSLDEKLLEACITIHWKYNLNDVQELLRQGADINCKNEKGQTPLILASMDNTSVGNKLSWFLIRKGADVNSKDKDGFTALTWACWNNNIKLAEELVVCNADVNIKFSTQMNSITLLMACCQEKRLKMIDFLLKNGANIEAEDINGNTALIRECYKPYDIKIKEILLDNGANINHQNNKGETPLIIACSRNYLQLVEFLLINNADFTIKDNRGNTALENAKILNNKEVINLLNLYEVKE